ncbi:MAG: TetR/AcrR family transcriptional regulator [Acidimicrobiales bacterium]
MSPEGASQAQWHQRTLDRSLRSARARALSRGDRFITAAAELLRETGKPEFTVQEVVDRSGMSLRSFYHHFATKDDLLLALIEETITSYVKRAQPKIEAIDDPVKKLRVFVEMLYGDEDSDDPAARGMVIFHRQLADSRTDEFVASLIPQTELLHGILEAGVASGAFRDDIPVNVLAAFITHSMVSMLDMRVMGISLADEHIGADDFWKCCLGVVATPAS